jgi:putative glutamate/gamma-aminobutyrate antiporter
MPASGKDGQKKYAMGVVALSLLNVAAIVSLKNLPTQAEYGLSIVFYLACSSLFFFIPSALVSAELATGWPKRGGVYLWVREAFGPRWGFVAIFMQWVENLPWFPAVFAFASSAIAYIIAPAWASNRYFTFAVIVIAIWICTFANFRGMKWSAFLSNSGVVVGTIIPGVLIILLAILWLALGRGSEVSFTWAALLPDLSNLTQIMLLAGMLMALAGMEMSAVHVLDVKNPSRDYPIAIFLSAAIVIVLSILGSLAISIVIPANQLSLAAGVLQAFAQFFSAFHVAWATPIIAFLLAYGAFTMAVTWMIGPSKGLLEVAREGYLPRMWQKRNQHHMPTGILLIQAVVASLLACAVLLMPTVSSAFWLMSALAAQLYLIMYLLMFAAAIRLRYSQADVPRAYMVPGGNAGMWAVAGIGWLASLAAILAGFVPPETVRDAGAGAIGGYMAFLIVGCAAFVALPIIFFRLSESHPEWRVAEDS